jgi:hypothetical protein
MMKLLTKAIEAKLPALYAQEKLGENAIAYVKFFCPWNYWTFYATEYDPKQKLFFGLVRGHETELGYFSLEELEQIRGKGWMSNLGMERDLYFTPCMLRECRSGNP